MTLRLLGIIVIPFVAGCASSLSTMFNRPVVENSVGGVISTVSLSADRRNVMVVTTPGKTQGRYCAEPPPDTAKEIATQLKAVAKLEAEVAGKPHKGEAEFHELVKEQMHVLASRTPALDAFRIGLYSLCQMYVIEAINEAQVNTLLGKLIDNYPWSATTPAVERKPAAGAAASGGIAGPSAPATPAAPAAPGSPGT
jgi:hypothetical protein